MAVFVLERETGCVCREIDKFYFKTFESKVMAREEAGSKDFLAYLSRVCPSDIT